MDNIYKKIFIIFSDKYISKIFVRYNLKNKHFHNYFKDRKAKLA